MISMHNRAAVVLHVFPAHAGCRDVRQDDESGSVSETSADHHKIVIAHFLCRVFQRLGERQEWIEVSQCLAVNPHRYELVASNGIGER